MCGGAGEQGSAGPAQIGIAAQVGEHGDIQSLVGGTDDDLDGVEGGEFGVRIGQSFPLLVMPRKAVEQDRFGLLPGLGGIFNVGIGTQKILRFCSGAFRYGREKPGREGYAFLDIGQQQFPR